ncbi:MAG: hypothetical protein P8184_14450 [Calditrichia bacterium]
MRWSLLALFFFSIPALLMTDCSPKSRLTPEAKAKLDPSLQKLLMTGKGDPNHYGINTLPDGSRVYSVIIRTNDPEALRKAGIKVGSVFGDVVTARLTIKELRKVAEMPAVRSIENSTKNYPSNQ